MTVLELLLPRLGLNGALVHGGNVFERLDYGYGTRKFRFRFCWVWCRGWTCGVGCCNFGQTFYVHTFTILDYNSAFCHYLTEVFSCFLRNQPAAPRSSSYHEQAPHFRWPYNGLGTFYFFACHWHGTTPSHGRSLTDDSTIITSIIYLFSCLHLGWWSKKSLSRPKRSWPWYRPKKSPLIPPLPARTVSSEAPRSPFPNYLWPLCSFWGSFSFYCYYDVRQRCGDLSDEIH